MVNAVKNQNGRPFKLKFELGAYKSSVKNAHAAVGGKVLGTAERVRINSAVAGGVDISTPNLTLGEQANITGDVRYVSDSELVRATGAVVTGVVSNVSSVPSRRSSARHFIVRRGTMTQAGSQKSWK